MTNPNIGKPKMTPKEAVEVIVEHNIDNDLDVTTALATLEAVVEDHDSIRIELAHTAERAKSLEGELLSAQDEAGRLKVAHRQMYAVAQEQVDLARKAEAELDAARPLLAAVERAQLPAEHPVATGISCHTLVFANYIHELDILRAALAYRASKEGK